MVESKCVNKRLGELSMKRISLLLATILPITALAVDQTELDAMLQTAATNQGGAYLAARNTVVNLGTNALPQLGQAAIDSKLPWQSRLVARICYEKILRQPEIAALTTTNWYAHPKFNPRWEMLHAGPETEMWKIVVPDLRNVGLWYYYLEIKWKQTGETPTRPLWRIAEAWPQWCFKAVKDEPERVWFLRVCSELMADPKYPGQLFLGLYDTLSRDKKSDTVPLLLQYFEKYNSLERGMEPYPGARDEGYRMRFAPIISFADSRHTDLLEKFISERPALASLTNQLAVVRARKVADEPEPPFRLGTNLVIVAP